MAAVDGGTDRPGVLGDVGIHILDFATYARARGSPASMPISPPFPKPRAMRSATMSSTPMTASP